VGHATKCYARTPKYAPSPPHRLPCSAQVPDKSAGYLGKRLLGRKRAPAKDPSDKTCCVVESVVAPQDDSSFVSHIADPVLRKLAEADRSLSGKSRSRSISTVRVLRRQDAILR
jgi:hypothetical protein